MVLLHHSSSLLCSTHQHFSLGWSFSSLPPAPSTSEDCNSWFLILWPSLMTYLITHVDGVAATMVLTSQVPRILSSTWPQLWRHLWPCNNSSNSKVATSSHPTRKPSPVVIPSYLLMSRPWTSAPTILSLNFSNCLSSPPYTDTTLGKVTSDLQLVRSSGPFSALISPVPAAGMWLNTLSISNHSLSLALMIRDSSDFTFPHFGLICWILPLPPTSKWPLSLFLNLNILIFFIAVYGHSKACTVIKV